MKTIWTNRVDYVVADNAEAAHECVKHSTGLTDGDLPDFDAWTAYDPYARFPWKETEYSPVVQLPVHEVLELVKPELGQHSPGSHGCGAIYFASDEW